MPHTSSPDDEYEDDGEESFEDPYPEDAEGDDVITCPNCKATISGLCDKCPKCGHWFTADDHVEMAGDDKPNKGIRVVTMIILAVIALLVVVAVIVGIAGGS